MHFDETKKKRKKTSGSPARNVRFCVSTVFSHPTVVCYTFRHALPYGYPFAHPLLFSLSLSLSNSHLLGSPASTVARLGYHSILWTRSNLICRLTSVDKMQLHGTHPPPLPLPPSIHPNRWRLLVFPFRRHSVDYYVYAYRLNWCDNDFVARSLLRYFFHYYYFVHFLFNCEMKSWRQTRSLFEKKWKYIYKCSLLITITQQFNNEDNLAQLGLIFNLLLFAIDFWFFWTNKIQLNW